MKIYFSIPYFSIAYFDYQLFQIAQRHIHFFNFYKFFQRCKQ